MIEITPEITFNELIYIHGYSQKDFAKAINVTANAVSNWNRGLFKPTPRQINKIARVLNLDPLLIGKILYRVKKRDY